MEKNLRKRLEEAAREYAHRQGLGDLNQHEIWLYKAGAEFGYKEAIKAAKEWMRNYFPDELDGKGFEFVKLDTILDDFETDMNKLWEEKK